MEGRIEEKYACIQVSLVAQMVKNLPAMCETCVQPMGQEDPLEEGMATHSSILAWRIPMDRGAWQAIVHRVAKLDTSEWWSTAQHMHACTYKLKSRDITLATKIYVFNAMVYPVAMYRCKSWVIKKAEHQRIDAFKLWCWRRLLSPLESKKIKSVSPKGNQPWLFHERTGAEVESPILKPPDAKSWLIGKDPDAGKD